MTRDDDRLAPVTPLFGGQTGAAQHPAGRERPAGVSGRRPSSSSESAEAAEGWAASDDADPGADEGPGEGLQRPASPAETAPRARLTALPTYAAFAARSEPEPAAETARSTQGLPPERAAAGEPDPEPEETLEAARDRAENISLHALSRRGVSSREMEKTLRSRDLPDEVVFDEIERLQRVGLLNDAELAENLVRQKQDRKGLGKSAVTAELRQRGIDQEAIEQAVADIDDDEEQARADEWAMKRAGQLRGLDQETAVRRLNGYLMRRGYRSEVVRRAIEKALPRGGSSRGGVRFE